MNVFISWSGENSKIVAQILREVVFLTKADRPWMSSEDIRAGSRWADELSSNLEHTHVGVLCLTKENANAPWILFEAGALSKSVKRGCIIPYLVDLEPDELPGPLRQFQAVRADEDGTLRLVRRLYELDPQNQPPPEFLDHLFRHTIWPTVKPVLPDAQPAEGAGPHNKELKLMKPSIMELRSS